MLSRVASLFRRRRIHVEVPRIRPRSSRQHPVSVNRVALGELTPELGALLGQAAYLQLSIFETAAHAVSTAPTARGKDAMSQVARLSLAKYDGLLAEMKRAGFDPVATMERHTSDTDAFRHDTSGADWYESLVTSYVTAGLLDDFFVRLSEGLSDDQSSRIAALLAPDSAARYIVDELRSAIEENPRLASRLALWGRRLVGDTLLVARSALAVPENSAPDEARLEPVFTEMIAAHTRRMDALGLTA